MAKINTILAAVFVFLLLSGFVQISQAKIRLVTLPPQEEVLIRLSDQNTTLVQEKRILSLKKGINSIDFSWQNVMIDPSSITLTPLSHPDKISILSVSYPPREAALVWNVHSTEDLDARVMISYLLSHIDGVIEYNAMTDVQEKKINLKTYLVLRNFSGQNFEAAHTQTFFGDSFVTSIAHLETQKILVSEKNNIPIKKIYTWDSQSMPHDPADLSTAVGIPVRYEFSHPLFKGKARLFSNDNQASTIFLGEDSAVFTPRGAKSYLRIGDSRDVVVTQRRMDEKKINIKRNESGHIQVHDTKIFDRIVMENLKESPVELLLVETIQGQWEAVEISMPYEKKDHKTLEFKISLAPRQKKTLELQYTVLNIFAGKFSPYNQTRD